MTNVPFTSDTDQLRGTVSASVDTKPIGSISIVMLPSLVNLIYPVCLVSSILLSACLLKLGDPLFHSGSFGLELHQV
jgi:hypothetical protein